MRSAPHQLISGPRYLHRLHNTAVALIAMMQLLSTAPVVFAVEAAPEGLLLANESISLWQITAGTESARLIWQQLDVVTSLAPVIGEEQLLIGSSGGLFALNRADGTVHWRFSGQDLIYTPVIDKTGNVKHAIAYAASRDGMLRAINTGDGSLLWQRSFPGWIYTPALSGGTLVTGGSASKLWGIDSETGAIRWQRELPGELVTAPLTSANDRIIVTTFSGDLLMLRARDGEIIWQHQLTTVAIHISANDKRIFSSGYDGVVHAMDAITGTRLWQHDTHGDRHQRLQITRAGLLVINERGLQQLDLHDGSMLARRDIDGEPIGSAQQIAGEYWIFYRQGRNPQPVRISF